MRHTVDTHARHYRHAEVVHAAADDGSGHCTLCGQQVTRIAGGQYVHPGGYVAARTPAAVLAARALVADWQQRATELSPPRPETHENTPEEEVDDTIADTHMDLARALADVVGAP